MDRIGARAELLADATIIPDGDRWFESDTAVADGNRFLYYYRIGDGLLPYAGLDEKGPIDIDASCAELPAVVQPCPSECDVIAGMTAAAIYACLEATGKLAALSDLLCGVAVTVFVHKANLAAAQADSTTVLTDQQVVVIDDTGATYYGPGGPTDTPAARVSAGIHGLGVIDGDPVTTVIPAGTFEVQLNEQP